MNFILGGLKTTSSKFWARNTSSLIKPNFLREVFLLWHQKNSVIWEGLKLCEFFSEVPQHELCVFPTNKNNHNHMQAKWHPWKALCMKDTQKRLHDFHSNVYIDSKTNIKKNKSRKKGSKCTWNLLLEYMYPMNDIHTHFLLSSWDTIEQPLVEVWVRQELLQRYHSRSAVELKTKPTKTKQKPTPIFMGVLDCTFF